MRFSLIAIPALLALSGCTSVQTNSFGSEPVVTEVGHPGQRASYGRIQVLYSEPHRDYDSLGVFSVKKYKPGWSDPTVSDAMPEPREAAAGLGADAVIIRSTQSNGYSRYLTIEGEAIRWR
jgi:hypothetical protein